MIDGLHVDDHVVLVALGFDEAGAKHLLGIHEGATENRESCTALMTNLVVEALAGRLAADYPSAAESLREGLDELFTVKELRVPEDLERGLSTTNAIENVNNGIRRITRRVKRWRGGSMILRWIGAALQELQAGFHRIKGYRGMKDLVAALRARDASLGPSLKNQERAA